MIRAYFLSGSCHMQVVARNSRHQGVVVKTKDNQSIAISAIKSRINSERAISKLDILGTIDFLSVGLARAKDALEKGERVEAHLIANVVMMTESIARWNTALELAPFLDHKESPTAYEIALESAQHSKSKESP
jgi:hypothetical protein